MTYEAQHKDETIKLLKLWIERYSREVYFGSDEFVAGGMVSEYERWSFDQQAEERIPAIQICMHAWTLLCAIVGAEMDVQGETQVGGVIEICSGLLPVDILKELLPVVKQFAWLEAQFEFGLKSDFKRTQYDIESWLHKQTS